MKNVVILFLLVLQISYGNELENNLASEYADCSAYYMVISKATIKQDKKVSDKAFELSKLHYVLSSKLSNEKTVISRVQLYMDNHYKLIENNYNNISRLMVKYQKFCIDLQNK